MTLADAHKGQRLVVRLDAGPNSQRSLWDLGITPGASIEVVAKHPLRGPLVVAADGIRVAIGRDLASKIPVTML